MESERKEQRSRVVRKGLGNSAYLVVLIGALVFANLVSKFAFARLDLTGDHRYTLSQASKTMVKDLKSPLAIHAFITGELPAPYNAMGQLADLLSEYEANSGGKFSFSIIDPNASDEDKERAANYGIRAVTIGEQSSDALSVREVFMGLVIVYQAADGDKQEVIPQIFPGMNYEYEISRRVRGLVRDAGPPKLGFVVGDGSFFDKVIEQYTQQQGQNPMQQGAPDPEQIKTQLGGQLKSQLFDDLFDIVWVDPTKPVDDSVDGIVVLGPTKELSSDAVKNLDAFVMKGKGAAFFVSAYRANTPDFGGQMPNMPKFTIPEDNKTGLDDALASYGGRINRDTILDREAPQVSVTEKTVGYFGDQPLTASIPILDPRLPLVPTINKDSLLVPNIPLLAFLPSDRSSPLPISSLSVTPEAAQAKTAGKLVVTEVASTAKTSVKRTAATGLSLDDAQVAKPDEVAGPFPVIATFEGTMTSGLGNGSTEKGRVLIASSGDFITNVFNQQDPLMDPRTMRGMPPGLGQSVQQYRRSAIDFFKNTADWLVSDPDLITIRGRGAASYIDVTGLDKDKKLGIQVANIAGLPIAFSILGVFAFFRRRARRAALHAQFNKA